MFRSISFTFIFICITSIVNCDEDCDTLGVLLYEDLHCKSVKPEGSKCPSHFECPDFKLEEDNCLFQSRRIPVGENLDQDVTYASCQVGCRCMGGDVNARLKSKDAGVLCAILDCPEWLGNVPPPGCYRTYKIGQCCSSGKLCPTPGENTTKCAVDGKEYLEGERFRSGCLECVCQKGWNGEFKEPFCKRDICAVEVRKAAELAQHCAPVYLNVNNDDKLCCPSNWACPSENDNIVELTPNKNSDAVTCKWGDKNVKRGEGVRTKISYYDNSEVDVTCECNVPPLLVCKGHL